LTAYLAALPRRRPDPAKPTSSSIIIVPDRPNSIVAPNQNHKK
jgi:hypothetical protein